MKLRVAITGAGGFLGRALARQLLEAGTEVQAFSRRDPGLPGVTWHAYDLAEPVSAALAACDVIVHAAFAMGRTGPALETLNREAAKRVLAIAREHQRHLVFISSMSAHADALSSYGRAKYAIEQTLDSSREAIVRPGLILGTGGVYSRMLDSLRRAPVVPLFFGGTQPVQPVAIDELVRALVRIVTERRPGVFNLGTPEPVTIRELYRRMLAAAGLRRPVVPLPGTLVLFFLRGTEALGLPLPLTRENLLGQKQLRTFETADSFARLGLPAPYPATLPWIIPNPTP